jgi:lipoyl(octanoyl) transferase
MSVLAKLEAMALRQAGRAGCAAPSTPAVGRLIISPPGEGAMNMAIDDALLDNAGTESRPTLRLYRWSQPTLSLGYFQTIASRSEHAASESLAVVRRASGGGAIIHDHELTYSLVVSSLNRSDRGSATAVYRAVHKAFIEVLADFGVIAQRFADTGQLADPTEPFLCF